MKEKRTLREHRCNVAGVWVLFVWGRFRFYNLAMQSPISIEPFLDDDWGTVSSIYFEGIFTANATFQQTVPDWMDWDSGHLRTCRIVAKSGSRIVGWAALSLVSKRYVYRGVAEVSVYVAEAMRGYGVGARLLSRLILDSETEGIWTLQAGIFPENIASIRLHTSAGFRLLCTRERIGCLNGSWRDVVLMERRSTTVGSQPSRNSTQV